MTLDEHDRQSADLSLIQGRSIAEIEEQDWAQSILQLERHYDLEHERRKWEAAVHGRKLT